MMKNIWLILTLAGSFALGGVPPAAAVTLTLVPSPSTIQVGGTISVDLLIAGLAPSGPPSLGAFLVETTYNSSVSTYNSVVFAGFLGNPGNAVETDIVVDTSMPGVVSLEEDSFLSTAVLDALQTTDPFLLATLTFTGSAAGVSPLGFGAIDLSSAAGTSLTNPTLQGASVTVTSMPEPGTLTLLAPFAVMAGAWRWRKGLPRQG
ncbi:MAG: hypothetical protein U1F76_28705 [Candidatus Competibacteraceae bacterium]